MSIDGNYPSRRARREAEKRLEEQKAATGTLPVVSQDGDAAAVADNADVKDAPTPAATQTSGVKASLASLASQPGEDTGEKASSSKQSTSVDRSVTSSAKTATADSPKDSATGQQTPAVDQPSRRDRSRRIPYKGQDSASTAGDQEKTSQHGVQQSNVSTPSTSPERGGANSVLPPYPRRRDIRKALATGSMPVLPQPDTADAAKASPSDASASAAPKGSAAQQATGQTAGKGIKPASPFNRGDQRVPLRPSKGSGRRTQASAVIDPGQINSLVNVPPEELVDVPGQPNPVPIGHATSEIPVLPEAEQSGDSVKRSPFKTAAERAANERNAAQQKKNATDQQNNTPPSSEVTTESAEQSTSTTLKKTLKDETAQSSEETKGIAAAAPDNTLGDTAKTDRNGEVPQDSAEAASQTNETDTTVAKPKTATSEKVKAALSDTALGASATRKLESKDGHASDETLSGALDQIAPVDAANAKTLSASQHGSDAGEVSSTEVETINGDTDERKQAVQAVGAVPSVVQGETRGIGSTGVVLIAVAVLAVIVGIILAIVFR